VAELGPGDSLGIGLSAVISGAERYFALDRKPFADFRTNLRVLDELLELFHRRAPIPDAAEFPGIFPQLQDYSFPHELLDPDWLAKCLAPQRVESIRSALNGTGAASRLRYVAPWDDAQAIVAGSVDWAFSQAVLEHVDDVTGTYIALQKWLRPGGIMSAMIDYSCHGITHDWCGHWTVSQGLWSLTRGNRPYFINRLPHSEHLRSMSAAGLELLHEMRISASPPPRTRLAREFHALLDADLETRGAFVIVRRLA
jgi:hypothetical protein